MNKYIVQIDNNSSATVGAEWVEEENGCLKFFVEDKELGGCELVAAFNKYDSFLKEGGK